MRGDEAIDELNGKREEFGLGERTECERGVKGFARDVFHDEEVRAALGVEIVDGGNVGVIEFGESVGFIVEVMAGRFVSDDAGRKELDGNIAIEVRITGEVHDTHPATADTSNDSVVAELGADERVLWQRGSRHGKTLSRKLS